MKCSELEGTKEENVQHRRVVSSMKSSYAMETAGDNTDNPVLTKRIPMSAYQSTGSLDSFFLSSRSVNNNLDQVLKQCRGTCSQRAGSAMAAINFEDDVKEEASGVLLSLPDENIAENYAASKGIRGQGQEPGCEVEQGFEQKSCGRVEPGLGGVSGLGNAGCSMDPPLDAPPPLMEASVPYTLRAVGHSLGGAALLIHLVMALREKRPHHLHKLVLLSPAGFHHKYPLLVYPLMWLLPFMKFVWTTLLRHEVCFLVSILR